MIEARRQQLLFGDGLIAEEVSDLREEWMKHAGQVLEDEHLVAAVYEALAKRSPKSRTRGRRGRPAEVVLQAAAVEAYPQLGLPGGGVRSPGQLVGVSRLHARGCIQGAGRQDDGPLGIGTGAGGNRKDSRANRRDRPGARRGAGAQDAPGHDRGGDEHPLPDRQQPAGRRRAGLDPRHETNRRNCRSAGGQAAGSQPECEAADPGNRPRGAHQRRTEPGAAAAGIREVVGSGGARGWPGESGFPARLPKG